MHFIQSRRPKFAAARAITVALLISSLVAACGGGTDSDNNVVAPSSSSGASSTSSSSSSSSGASSTSSSSGSSSGASSTSSSSSSGGPPPTFTISGSISGLAGTGLAIADTAGSHAAVISGTSFTISSIASGATYAVNVTAQPTGPSQTCSVASGGGTATGNVTGVAVTCVTNSYSISGTIIGVTGTGLALSDGAGHAAVITGNTFTIAAVPSGTTYTVTATVEPTGPTQTCLATSGGSGVVTTANVTGVVVTCTTNTYSISGTISGLAGTGLAISDGAGHAAVITGNAFTISAVPSGTTYAVAASANPTGPSQTCTATTGGAGTVTTANVTGVVVTCVTNGYSISGTISGLTGTGLALSDGAGHAAVITGNAFTISAVPSGTTYAVAATANPTGPTQTCSATTGGAGTVTTANVTGVVVTCVTTNFTISGTISGLTGTGLALSDGAGHAAVISGSTFTISAVPSGTTYAVAATTNPTGPTQTCSATTGGAGTVTTTNVTGVVVTCTTTNYTLSGTITGLAGTGLALSDGAGHAAVISGNNFTISIPDGTIYQVAVTTQPTVPAQFCRVGGVNGAGTVAAAAISGVIVNCLNVGQFLWDTNPFDNSGSGSVGAFTIDPTSGALTAVGGFPAATDPTADNQPFAIVLDPNAQFVYVANNAGTTTPTANVATDSADTGTGGTGALTQDVEALSVGPASTQPCALAINTGSSGTTLYVGSADFSLGASIAAFPITNGTAGAALTSSGSTFATNVLPCGLAVDSTKTLLFATTQTPDIFEYTINADGSLTGLRFFGLAGNSVTYGVAASPIAQFFYAADNANNGVAAIGYDNTGALTSSNFYPVGASPEGIAIDPLGKFLYVYNGGDGTVSAFSVNGDGSLSVINGGTAYTSTGVPSISTPTSIAIDPSGQFLYAADGDAGTITPFTIGVGGVLTKGTPVSATIPSGAGGPSSLAIK